MHLDGPSRSYSRRMNDLNVCTGRLAGLLGVQSEERTSKNRVPTTQNGAIDPKNEVDKPRDLTRNS
jgi:hypothetical protein